jgi:uncharacterized membrane protein
VYALEMLSHSQKLADKVARFGGSWRFIILFGIVLGIWIIFNVIAIGHYKFDPYPFILNEPYIIVHCSIANPGYYDEPKPARREG